MTINSAEERKKLGQSLYTRALNLASEDQLAQAESHFVEALRHCPDDARIWYHRGHLLEQMGQLETAIHCYDSARTRDRSNPMYERAWRESVKLLGQVPAIPTDAGLDETEQQKRLVDPKARTQLEEKVVIDLPPPPVLPDRVNAETVEEPPVIPRPRFESVETQIMNREQQGQPPDPPAQEPPPPPIADSVTTVERIGGTWVLWSRNREDPYDELDTLRTSSDAMFSDASNSTLVVPLDDLQDEEQPPVEGQRPRDTASLVNRRKARILDSGQLSLVAMACLRLIAEGDAEQVVELIVNNKYPDLAPAESCFLLSTAYITLAEQALDPVQELDGGLAEHLKTLKLWFDQR